MDNGLRPGKPTKPYFLVTRPAHFLFRSDLIEELCVAEAMARTLPKTEKQHETWLRICGHSAQDFPFVKALVFSEKPYELTRRYVLQAAVLAGNTQYTNLVTDGNLWSVASEYGGLFRAVIDRAVEFATFLGLRSEIACGMFVPTGGADPATKRVNPRWSVGYERSSGLCTILATDHAETARMFLEDRYGYFSPFQKPL